MNTSFISSLTSHSQSNNSSPQVPARRRRAQSVGNQQNPRTWHNIQYQPRLSLFANNVRKRFQFFLFF